MRVLIDINVILDILQKAGTIFHRFLPGPAQGLLKMTPSV